MRGDINFKVSYSSDLSVYFLFCAPAVLDAMPEKIHTALEQRDAREEVFNVTTHIHLMKQQQTIAILVLCYILSKFLK